MNQALFYAFFLSPQLIAFAAITLFTGKEKKLSVGLSIGAAGLMALLAWSLLLYSWNNPQTLEYTVPWLAIGKGHLGVGYLFDRLSVGMLTVVTTVGLLVQIYSIGYMQDDPGISRYFAFMSLFSWAMGAFVMASNILIAYVFWELVGATSYLLIGFWYNKPSAAAAAKKAFVVTRFGDTGFFLGVILLLILLGNVDYTTLNAPGSLSSLSPALVTTITALIFLGIMGKSAQFPLHAWLPDAMEGPTPVSALIHSATMVAAGIYLFARSFDFFHQAVVTIQWILIIGTVTAFTAATMALVQRDIKRILAYSTISQLGYMVMALAAGSHFAGVFHLTTHAFFKAMMFLAAGCLIHAYHSNDIYEIAKSRLKGQRTAFLALLVGALSLSGVFPFSGFFSKETILGALEHLPSHGYFWVAAVTSMITAVYAFRMIFVLVFGHGGKGGAHPHPSPAVMNVPLWCMMGVTMVLGWLAADAGGTLLPKFLQTTEKFEWHLSLFAMTQIGCAGAILLAWFSWGKRPLIHWRIGFAERFLLRKYFVDDAYHFIVHGVFMRVCRVMHWTDRNIVDGMVNGTGRMIVGMGRNLSRVAWGEVQFYLGFAFGTVAIVVGFLTYLR